MRFLKMFLGLRVLKIFLGLSSRELYRRKTLFKDIYSQWSKLIQNKNDKMKVAFG